MTTSLRRLLEQEAQRTKRSPAPLDDVMSGGASVVRRRRVVGIAIAAAVALIAVVVPWAIVAGSDTDQPIEGPQCETPWLIGSGYSRAAAETEIASPDFTEVTALPRAGSLSPTFSPDGTRIASVEYLDEMAGAMVTSAIVVTDVDGGNAHRITDDTRRVLGPAWSPDGKRIAYTSSRYTNRWTPGRLHIVNADGTDRQTIELTTGVDSDVLAWADDRTILYESGDVVWRVDLDAQEPITPDRVRRIPERSYASQVHFSPDATDVVLSVGGRESHVEIVDLATGRTRSIPDSEVVGWGSVQALGWTGDGQLLFGRDVKSDDPDVFEIFDIWAVSDGGWGESSQVRAVDADDLQPLPYAVNPTCSVPE